MAENSQTFPQIIYSKDDLGSFTCMDITNIFEKDDVVYKKYGSDKLKIVVRRMGQKPTKDVENEWFKRPNEFVANKAVKIVKFISAIVYLMRAFQFIETMPYLKNVLFVFGKWEMDNFDFSCSNLPINHNVTHLEIKVNTILYKRDTHIGRYKTNQMILETLKMAFKCFPSLQNLNLLVPRLSQKDHADCFGSVLEKNLPKLEHWNFYKKTNKYRFGLDFEEYIIRWSTKELIPEKIPKSPESNSSKSSCVSTKTLVSNEDEDILSPLSNDLGSIFSNDLEHEDMTGGIDENEDIQTRSCFDLKSFFSNDLDLKNMSRGIKRSSSCENVCAEIGGSENSEALIDNGNLDLEIFSRRSFEEELELEDEGTISKPHRKKICYFHE